jgi:protein-L-isoaspartate(D-aspartate) O-methyltransferase
MEGDPTRDGFRRDDTREAVAGLVLALRQLGIRDRTILAAIEHVPRRLFVPAHLKNVAYEDRPLPIECGQTISAPSVVAIMCQALALSPSDRVLEIGTGSGYQAAVLAHLAAEIFTVERYRSLGTLAEQRLKALRIRNVVMRHGDGLLGWPEKAPFDRIVVTAAATEIPRALVQQMKVGGVMVVPVGEPGSVQRLMKVVRQADGVEANRIADVRFVPVVPGIAERL